MQLRDRYSLLALSLVIVFCTPVAIVKASGTKHQTPGNPGTQDNLLSIKNNAGYKHLIDRLKHVVAEKSKTPDNHFFIAKYPANQSYTYMFWREGQFLWLLDIGGDDPGHWRSVEHPSGGEFIDLTKDVVATPEEIGTSTYLVDQLWVNERLYEAVMKGDLILIKKPHK